jgi:nitrite reductase (NADH) large subunit
MSRLKVVQIPVYSIMKPGVQRSASRTISYVDAAAGRLCKLHVRRRKIVGATMVGDWPETGDVHQAIMAERRIWPWQLFRFSRRGVLLDQGGGSDPTSWTDSALVCTCMGVTCGAIRQAVAEGFVTVDALRERTGASQACASCRPVLGCFIRQSARPPPLSTYRPAVLAGSGLAAFGATLLLALQPVAVGRSVRDRGLFERVLLDPVAQQLTGYAALALCMLTLLLSVRKRWSRFAGDSYASWRVFHVFVGTAALLALVLHTGFVSARISICC